MLLAVYAGVVAALWAILVGAALLTGGIRTKHGLIVGRQKTPKQLDEYVRRVVKVPKPEKPD